MHFEVRHSSNHLISSFLPCIHFESEDRHFQYPQQPKVSVRLKGRKEANDVKGYKPDKIDRIPWKRPRGVHSALCDLCHLIAGTQPIKTIKKFSQLTVPTAKEQEVVPRESCVVPICWQPSMHVRALEWFGRWNALQVQRSLKGSSTRPLFTLIEKSLQNFKVTLSST
jgi:hypothetical protein